MRRAACLLALGAFVAASPVLAHEGMAGMDGMHPAHFAADARAGAPGDPKATARSIDIVMSEDGSGMRFEPAAVSVRPGEQVRFVIHNKGQLAHEFVLGTKAENREHAAMMADMPDMKHDDPNAVTVAPGATATLLWRFPNKGDLEFACLIPGHYEAGMHGEAIVK